MTALLFGTVLPWLLVAMGTWLGFQLVRQNGRLLLRLESIEKRLAPHADTKRREAEGLSVGTLAPAFELPDLAGTPHKLSEFRDSNVLLIFFNPQCGFCTKMAADLAALPADGGVKEAIPVVITTGDPEENRKLVAKYGIRCLVLLQEGMEIASKFRAQGTPMGYRIDGAGRIASALTVGAEPLLQLATAAVGRGSPPVGRGSPDPARMIDRRSPEHTREGDLQSSDSARSETRAEHASSNGSARLGLKDYRSLAGSRLNRSGLKAGTPAPDFRLPRIDGGDLALADLRGGRVLLVFSDPDCGPCEELAPRLQEIHLQRSDLQVLMISRGEIEANRAKAAGLGLSFPIVVQKQWEISLLYGMFATPVGYLIDEQGILTSDVAVGVGPILALMDNLNITKVFDGGTTASSPPLRKGGPGRVDVGVPASAGALLAGKEPAWAN